VALTCPKCTAAMRSYERNGVTIDQCIECRGIFLDRGELERLVDGEGAYYAAPRPAEPPRREAEHRDHDRDREPTYRHHDDDDDWRRKSGHQKKHRGGFLSELFD
jgi:Zn-finger nucleic acid-binding protein